MHILGTDFSDQQTAQADHAWMERMVHELQEHLPRMLREHRQRGEFWDWFCGETDSLFRYVQHDEDRRYFQEFINRTLADAGLAERFDPTPRAAGAACVCPAPHLAGRRCANPPPASHG